jgi:hypothetical protein
MLGRRTNTHLEADRSETTSAIRLTLVPDASRRPDGDREEIGVVGYLVFDQDGKQMWPMISSSPKRSIGSVPWPASR